MVATPLTPNIIRHFEPNNEDAQVELTGPFPQGVSPHELVESSLLRVIVRGVVFVRSFTLTLHGIQRIQLRTSDTSPTLRTQFAQYNQDYSRSLIYFYYYFTILKN
jgi:hypothetical protein